MKTLLFRTVFASLLITGSGCISSGPFGIRGEGPIVERKVDLDNLEGISLPGSAKIFLSQGEDQEVRIEGQENIIDNLNLDVRSNIWHIGNKKPVWQSETLKIFITIATIKSIKISGSGSVKSESHFTNLKDLDIRISGSGKLDMDFDVREVTANISGSGDMIMKGLAKEMNLTISGSGEIHAYELQSERADVRISGSGSMFLSVKDQLDANVSGSGNITYKGNPKTNTSVSGSGNIRSR
jgi:hypothetical protein